MSKSSTQGLGRGVNIGGWISQSNLSTEHLQSFITREDLMRIADWGFENIRLPFDYDLIESESAPGKYREEGFQWMDKGLDWAQEAGLKVVLDMHKSPGFIFTEALENPRAVPKLLTHREYQERFFNLWQTISRRYLSRREGLVFELLNEVTAPEHQQWNELVKSSVRAIRMVDSERTIVVGSNRWNSALTFNELVHLEDPAIIYTFHFYEPLTFTHQKARWVPEIRDYDTTVSYPGKAEGLLEAAKKAESEGKHDISEKLIRHHEDFGKELCDKSKLESWLSQVLAFRKRHGAVLYCGEFGVLSTAPKADRLAWYEDFLDLLRQHDIGWSVWSYKGMGFGSVDKAGNVIAPKLLEILRKKA